MSALHRADREAGDEVLLEEGIGDQDGAGDDHQDGEPGGVAGGILLEVVELLGT